MADSLSGGIVPGVCCVAGNEYGEFGLGVGISLREKFGFCF